MTIEHFEEVSLRASGTFRCRGCNRRLVRSKKFYQTLNPFNVNQTGSRRFQRKTRSEIVAELNIEVTSWQATPMKCKACS